MVFQGMVGSGIEGKRVQESYMGLDGLPSLSGHRKQGILSLD
jgi:hypothetical protein